MRRPPAAESCGAELALQQERQRELERRIRKTKREAMALKEARDDAEDPALKAELEAAYRKKALLLQRQNREYNSFCEENGLKRLQDRLHVAGWNRKQAAAASAAARKTPTLERRTVNPGPFEKLPERMSKKHIRSLAKEFDISMKGVKIEIDKDPEKLKKSFMATGRADTITIGRIDFFPKAFTSREELVRTLYHEITHVQQFKEFGTEYVQLNMGHFEDLAYAAEEEFIERMRKEGRI